MTTNPDDEAWPEFPKDDVVDGVPLTFCTFCACIAGRVEGRTEYPAALAKCESFDLCRQWKKKEDVNDDDKIG